jgi:anti-sigma B factor antagonist
MYTNLSPVVVTAPSGRLDEFAGKKLSRGVGTHVGRRETNHVLDLRAIDELNHEAIRAIIKVLRSVRDAGGQVRLVVDDAAALGLLRLTALDRVFEVYPTVDAAVIAFGATELVSAS